MVTYLYRCPKCDSTKEVTHSIADCDKVKIFCEECEGPPLEMERVLEGGTGFILKGKRWARDGYSNDK